jgi:hypothetical protein
MGCKLEPRVERVLSLALSDVRKAVGLVAPQITKIAITVRVKGGVVVQQPSVLFITIEISIERVGRDHLCKRRGGVILVDTVVTDVIVEKTGSLDVPKETLRGEAALHVIIFIRRSIPIDLAEADFVDVRVTLRGDIKVSEARRKINGSYVRVLVGVVRKQENRSGLRPVGRGEREQCQGKAKQDFIFCEHKYVWG